jgi:hypothetical protein|tara:strand:- start:98 stop:658 length:561 start_codon:yes stop_codon:yes gene_type:complete
MAKETLRQYLNRMLKSKGKSLSEEKKKASKYSSIAAAKKAGSLYYTNKDGKVMAAVFAEDLKDRTTTKPPVKKPAQTSSGRGSGSTELNKRKTDIESPTSAASRRAKSRAASKTLEDMRKSGLRAPKLSPKGREAQGRIDSAKAGDKSAAASRAKRYTKPQWKAMSPTERAKLGLPRRSSGVQFKN